MNTPFDLIFNRIDYISDLEPGSLCLKIKARFYNVRHDGYCSDQCEEEITNDYTVIDYWHIIHPAAFLEKYADSIEFDLTIDEDNIVRIFQDIERYCNWKGDCGRCGNHCTVIEAKIIEVEDERDKIYLKFSGMEKNRRDCLEIYEKKKGR